MYLKSTPPRMFSSYETSKGKNKDFARQNKFFAMPMPLPNANADAEMPMSRFPNGENNPIIQLNGLNTKHDSI